MRASTCLAFACLAALALAGCGRRGPLELPPGAPAQAASAQRPPLYDPAPPGLIQSPNRVIERTPEEKQQVFSEGNVPRPINAPPAPKTGKSFVLDPLL